MQCRQECARQRNRRRHVKFVFCYFRTNLFQNNLKKSHFPTLRAKQDTLRNHNVLKNCVKSVLGPFLALKFKALKDYLDKQRDEICLWRENSNNVFRKIKFQTLCHPIYWFKICQISNILMNPF